MLGDFRTDSRMLLLIAIALPLGVISAFIIGGWRATARIKSAEAIEAILLGGSVISPKVAFPKPISSAISIGTGGHSAQKDPSS